MKITKYCNGKNASGKMLRKLRLEANMSQQDLATKLQLKGVDLTSKEISKQIIVLFKTLNYLHLLKFSMFLPMYLIQSKIPLITFYFISNKGILSILFTFFHL